MPEFSLEAWLRPELGSLMTYLEGARATLTCASDDFVFQDAWSKVAMAAPVSVRLDDDVRETLEAEARARHIGLSTYLRQIAIETATRLRRERIRAQSRAVGEYVAESADAAAFYEEWGTPKHEDE